MAKLRVNNREILGCLLAHTPLQNSSRLNDASSNVRNTCRSAGAITGAWVTSGVKHNVGLLSVSGTGQSWLGNSAEMSEFLRITDTHTHHFKGLHWLESWGFFWGDDGAPEGLFWKVLPVTVLRFGFVVLCFAKKKKKTHNISFVKCDCKKQTQK